MDEWVWSNGGMILTGNKLSTGRITLYSVGGRWMNEYRAMVEWYWQMKTNVHAEKAIHKSACCAIWPRELLVWYVTVGEIRSCKFVWLSTGSRMEPQLKMLQIVIVPAAVIKDCRLLLECYSVRKTQCIPKVTFWQPHISHICSVTLDDVPRIHLAYHVERYGLIELVSADGN